MQITFHGEVLASAHLLREQIGEMDTITRDFLCILADLAARRWEETNAGMWEGREVERAREVFEAVCARANDVGLLAEQVDPDRGALLGNFPQGFSHVGLITAAWSIDQGGK